MLEHQLPFESLSQPRDGCFLDEPALRANWSGVGFLLLQSTSVSSLQETVAGEIGLELPAPQRASVIREYALLWLTPAEWLLELPANAADSVQDALAGRLAASLAAVTDMTDAYACCDVSGTRAAEVLMGGCSLDLHVPAFPSGQVARTALAGIPAVIWNPGNPDRLRCILDRSFAAHFRDWLMDAARARGV